MGDEVRKQDSIGDMYPLLIKYNTEKCIVLTYTFKKTICFVDDGTEKLKRERYGKEGPYRSSCILYGVYKFVSMPPL